MELQQSKTWENLNNSFNAEARAAMLYWLYADRARKDGQYTTGEIFDRGAHNETAHAKIWYEFLHPDAPDTEESLRLAAEGEHMEWTEMYNKYAQTARDEGFANIARLFDLVAGVEKEHELIYNKQRTALANGSAVSAPDNVTWICQNCGYHHSASSAPDICPICGHNQGYFSAATNE